MSGKVEVLKGRGKRTNRKGVVVYLKGVPGGKKKRARREIRQKDRHFVPKVTVVAKGTTVDFPNDDKVAHNVYSPSPRFRSLDLGEYKGGKSKDYKFKRTGDVVLKCNIHPRMKAKVKVVDNDYYTRTDADGNFEIRDVPPGSYKIVTWLPTAVEKTDKVTIKAGKNVKIGLKIQVGDAPSIYKDRENKTKTVPDRYPY